MNSALGSVVPLTMFYLGLVADSGDIADAIADAYMLVLGMISICWCKYVDNQCVFDTEVALFDTF